MSNDLNVEVVSRIQKNTPQRLLKRFYYTFMFLFYLNILFVLLLGHGLGTLSVPDF